MECYFGRTRLETTRRETLKVDFIFPCFFFLVESQDPSALVNRMAPEGTSTINNNNNNNNTIDSKNEFAFQKFEKHF